MTVTPRCFPSKQEWILRRKRCQIFLSLFCEDFPKRCNPQQRVENSPPFKRALGREALSPRPPPHGHSGLEASEPLCLPASRLLTKPAANLGQKEQTFPAARKHSGEASIKYPHKGACEVRAGLSATALFKCKRDPSPDIPVPPGALSMQIGTRGLSQPFENLLFCPKASQIPAPFPSSPPGVASSPGFVCGGRMGS